MPPKHSEPYDGPFLGGVLEVTVVEGEGLIALDSAALFGKNKEKTSDPYVRLCVVSNGGAAGSEGEREDEGGAGEGGGAEAAEGEVVPVVPVAKAKKAKAVELARTSVVKKSLSPEWGQSFTIAMAAEAGPLLLLQIFDQDLLSGDDEMGTSAVDVTSLPPGIEHELWRAVEPCDGCPAPTGRLRVRFRFRPTRVPYLGGIVEVKVVGAADLLAMDGGGLFGRGKPKSSDPYVRVLGMAAGGPGMLGKLHVGQSKGRGVFDSMGGHSKGKELARTSVVKKSLSPEWGQSFTIAMAAEAGPLLLLQIFDQDLLSGDDEMGAVTVDLGALPPGKFDDQWRDVGACDGCPEAAGRLRLRLRFRPRRAPYLGGVLEATVVEAADLVGMDGGGLFDKNAPKTSDPYVKLLALAQGVGAFEAVGGHGKGKELAKTNVVKKSLAPQWGQHFKLTLPAQLGTLVLFHLFDQDLMSGDDPMGAIAIDLAALWPGKEDDQWRDVGPCKGCAAAAGRLRLRLRFKPTRPAVEEVAVEEEVDENLIKVGDLVHFAGGRFPVVEESRDSVGNPKFKVGSACTT